MPTYNRSQFFLNSFATILNQSVNNWELIVVDDGSDQEEFDKILVILIPFMNHPKWQDKIKLIRLEENSGSVSIPRAIGISHARGEFIAHTDDDVYNDKNKFYHLMRALIEQPKAYIAYGDRQNAQAFSLDDEIVIDWTGATHHSDPTWNPGEAWGVDGGQYIYRANIYDSIPLVFCRRACDWETAKKIWNFSPTMVYKKEAVCTYLWHDKNRSLDDANKDRTIYPAKYLKYFDPEFLEVHNCQIPESV